MPMQMTFRWYGEGNDRISLSDIKQIPGVTGIVWALHHKMPGEIWEESEIAEVKRQLDQYGFNMDVVESVNVHDDIKIGLPTRDHYIENYKTTIRNLSKFGVKVICYNFMPIFDWTRSNLFHPVGDGSTALFYEKNMIQDDYNAMAKYILDFTEKYHMSFPGWEPERMAKLDELFRAYEGIDHEKLWANLKYFLDAIMPTCEACGIKMAIHMDDPPWDIFGLPRLLVDEASIDRFLKMVDHPCNCLTLCSGSLGANPDNDVAAIVRKHCDRIAFAHIRNVRHFENGDFSEASHRDCDGDTGILDILKAYHDCGFEGYIRPDHGRHLWSEGPGTVRPGYGLYDRAMGIMYMLGVWDMLDKIEGKKMESSKPEFLYHGSPYLFDIVEPQQACGANPQESQKAIYAGTNFEHVIPFALPIRWYPDNPSGKRAFTCEICLKSPQSKTFLNYGSLDPNGVGYVYKIRSDSFTKVDDWQWVSPIAVVPTEIIKIKVSDYINTVVFSEEAKEIHKKLYS